MEKERGQRERKRRQNAHKKKRKGRNGKGRQPEDRNIVDQVYADLLTARFGKKDKTEQMQYCTWRKAMACKTISKTEEETETKHGFMQKEKSSSSILINTKCTTN